MPESDDWGSLTEEQRQGMTEEYWHSLSAENRRAFLDRDCARGDGKPRVYGSPFCADHLKAMQEEWRGAAN